MEVAVAEEKKKIFRARKTMKISDRQQLDSLHTTLLTPPTATSDTFQPIMNGTHKEEEQKVSDKEPNNILDSNSPSTTFPASPGSQSSSAPLPSPIPVTSQSPKVKEDTSPSSPFHSLNIELKKMQEDEKEENDKKVSSKSQTNRNVTPPLSDSKESSTKDLKVKQEKGKKEAGQTTSKNSAVESALDCAAGSVSSPTPETNFSEPMEMDSKTEKDEDLDSSKEMEEKPSSPKSTADSLQSCHPSSHSASSSSMDNKQEKEIENMDKKEEKRENVNVRKGSVSDAKIDVDLAKTRTKTEKVNTSQAGTSSRPSSTPPSDTAEKEKISSPGLKRTLSEGNENDEPATKRELKRAKVEREELEAELELKITAKAGSHHKLEKIVQQLVDKQLRALQVTIFDKHLKELKDRVDRIDCSVKHQSAITALQAKIARLAKKFGEANQATENKKKQEAVVAAAAVAKTATVPVVNQVQRPARTSVELKQASTTVSSSKAAVATPIQQALPAPVAAAAPVPASTSTAMVTQTPILQLITSTANAASTLATGITSQSPTGTLLLKAGPGGSMVASGQPLLIQLPLSMPNGPAGTLVNIPVSNLSAVSSLNKAKTTASAATFILKPASAVTTAPASSPAVATVPALQASGGQMSVARVYQGGTGGITTPNAGISVTTARTPAQSVSVAGAMSSVSSPATSGPAATGSTAPGPPQGTSLTSKTDNQAAGSTPSKANPAATRPKGSVIDLTEDDDDVQVTGVRKATVTTPSPAQRTHPVISISNSKTTIYCEAKSSPQTNQNSIGNPQLTVHHRPQVDSPLKPRASATTNPPVAASTVTLPPLPLAVAPPCLSPEAERTSPPQQPQLKLMQSPSGIVLSWCVAETDRTCAAVDSYHLYAYHQDNATQQNWKKIGEVKALPLPMACTLTQFQSGATYHFAVRAKDVHGRFGSFCEPQCTNVMSSSSS